MRCVPAIINFTLESAAWVVHGGDSSSLSHAPSAVSGGATSCGWQGRTGSGWEGHQDSQPGASVAVRIGFSMGLWREASSRRGGCVTKEGEETEVEAAN